MQFILVFIVVPLFSLCQPAACPALTFFFSLYVNLTQIYYFFFSFSATFLRFDNGSSERIDLYAERWTRLWNVSVLGKKFDWKTNRTVLISDCSCWYVLKCFKTAFLFFSVSSWLKRFSFARKFNSGKTLRQLRRKASWWSVEWNIFS